MRWRTEDVLVQLAGGRLPSWRAFAAGLRRQRFSAGAALFEQGEPVERVFVVVEGLVKLVYRGAGGEAWVKSFIRPGGLFTSLTAVTAGDGSAFAAVAVTDILVESFPYAALRAMADRHLPWSRASVAALERYGTAKERRERQLLTLDATGRYRSFLAEFGATAGRIPKQDVALYIGVTPVALSRIRRRLGLTRPKGG